MLTRNSLKALGIESEKIDAIIDGHVETVNGLKAKTEELQAELDKAKGAMGERDDFKGKLDKANERIKALEALNAGQGDITSERDQLKNEVDTLKAEIETITTERDTSNTELTSLREKVATFESEKATLTENANKVQKEFDDFKALIETEKTNTVKRDAVRDALRNNGVARPEFQDLIINALDLNGVTVGEKGIENVDALIESTKTKYPACFAQVQEGGTPPVNPLGGNPPRPLKKEDISKMTPEQINAAWDRGEIQSALSYGN